MTGRDGRVSKLEQVFLRGGQIKFIVLPELLKSAPVLKKIQALRAKSTDPTPRGLTGKGRGAGKGPASK